MDLIMQEIILIFIEYYTKDSEFFYLINTDILNSFNYNI